MTGPASGRTGAEGSDLAGDRSVPRPVSAERSVSGVVDTVDGERNDVLRRVVAALGNVAVLTALLVYFGWVRSDVQSRQLGIDESILGMSTRDYLLRSVRPVLVLLAVVALAGLFWLSVDRWLFTRLRNRGSDDRTFRWVVRLMPVAVVVLPFVAWLVGFVWKATAFIAFPLCVAAGLLLLLYAFHLRQALPDAIPLPADRESLLRIFTAVIVGIAMFSSAANYATVEGTRLARGFQAELPKLTRVVVYSAEDLHINAPGVRAEPLMSSGEPSGLRYVGLRLLEHTGGRYFLVSDEWSPQYGVVVVLADDAPVRLEFVRDRR